MTPKDKVLKVRPDAYHNKFYSLHFIWENPSQDPPHLLAYTNTTESEAWESAADKIEHIKSEKQ